MRKGIVRRVDRHWVFVLFFALTGCSGSESEKSLSAVDASDAGAGDSNDSSAPGGGEPGGGSGESDEGGDGDGDGLPNGSDNCPNAANPEQADRDGDGWGDLCDSCPIVANATQEPVKCATGAIGEDDQDGDEAKDAKDNCALVANFDQLNSDGDLFGDACDNCPSIANDNQANVDGDRLGDACDEDLSNEEACAEGSTRAELLEPNLYFLFDTSGSMADSDIDNLNNAVKQALLGPDRQQGTKDDLVNHFNVGMATFPNTIVGGCFFQPQQRLALSENNSSQSLIRVLPSTGSGGTPTAAALGGVLSKQLFVLKGETPSTRPAAVVLLTDGEPNDCGGQSGTVQQAGRLSSLGVPVYVIAYKIKGEELKQATEVAAAGSVNRANPQRPLEASDAAGIEAAFSSIRSKVSSCKFPFDTQANANFDRVEVILHVGSTMTELSEGNNGYKLDVASRSGELTGTACETFKAHAEDGSASVELRVACKAQCQPMTEICDFRDNNCDGNIDEGCSSTPPEVCNGVDDDGDGRVDEGCPISPV